MGEKEPEEGGGPAKTSNMEMEQEANGNIIPAPVPQPAQEEEEEVYQLMEQQDEDDLGLSSISTTATCDLFDEAVMGFLGDGEELSSGGSAGGGGDGQQLGADTVASEDDEVFTPPTADKEKMEEGGGGRTLPINSICSRFAVYVGNLTWWTTSEDIRKGCGDVGVDDVVDIRIFECRANGQSKGYALLSLASLGSLKLLTERLDKTEIHGRTPLLKPDTKASQLFFESLSKTRPPTASTSSSSSSGGGAGGDNSLSSSGYGGGAPVTTILPNGQGPRYPLRQQYHHSAPQPQRNYWSRGGGMGHSSGGPPPPRQWSPHWSRYSPRMSNGSWTPRGPPPPLHHGGHYEEWRGQRNYPPHRVHFNPAFLNRLPPLHPSEEYAHGPPNCGPILMMEDEEEEYSYNKGGGEYEMDYHPGMRPVSRPTSSGAARGIESQPVSCSSNYEITCSPNTTTTVTAMEKEGVVDQPRELDVEQLLERNSSVCSQAIQRAVADATAGEYASSIETLVTAISLIRGSKISADKRCQVLISSLEQSLQGIENRSYGKGLKSERDGDSSSSRRGSSRRSSPSGRRHYDYEERGGYSSRYPGSSSRRSGESRRRTWEDCGRDSGSEEERRASKSYRIEEGPVYRR